MTKVEREELISEVKRELIGYLSSGTIDQSVVTDAFDVSGLGIADFARLKSIRFALSEDVRKYLKKLQTRLRSIRTASEVETEQRRGEIRGAIDWGQTVRERYSRNPHDKALFVTRTPYTEYQLPENIFLKTFLGKVARIAKQDLLEIDQDWRRDLWADDGIEDFIRLFDRNVHLDRIEADHSTVLRPRQVNAARQSRQRLYYRAFELFRRYEKLLDNEFDDDNVEKLLRETLAIPETARLFELACTFRLLRGLEEELEITLQPIKTGSGPIARGHSTDWDVRFYHDETGNLRIHETFPDHPRDTYLKRLETAHKAHRDHMDNERFRAIFSGQPDLIVEICPAESSDPTHIILGEVKYSAQDKQLSEGVLELNKYLRFARARGDSDYEWPVDTDVYLADVDEIQVTGLVITAGAPTRISENRFRHVHADELSSGELSNWLLSRTNKLPKPT